MNYIRQNSSVFIVGSFILATLVAAIAIMAFQARRVEIRTEKRIDSAWLAIDATVEKRMASIESLTDRTCTGTIDDLPIVIIEPGRYCLTRTITSTGVQRDAIHIRTNDVTIDGQGFAIQGRSNPATTTRGILAIDRSGITIEDIRIVGFYTAVLVGDTGVQIPGTSMRAGDHASRDIKIVRVRIDGPTFQGIYVSADNFSITDSAIAGVGPSTAHPHSFATGIFTRGNNCEISGNRLRLGTPTGTGENIGIALYLGAGCRIESNTVLFDKYPEWGRNFGIWTKPESGSLPLVQSNSVSGAHYAFGPHGVFEANVATNTSCALFTFRPSGLNGFIDRGGNNNYTTNSQVRPGDRTCPDDIERSKARYASSPGPEAAYAVALTYGEISAKSVVETLTWLLVAAHHGHPVAQQTAADPTSGGYSDDVVAKARAASAEIISKPDL